MIELIDVTKVFKSLRAVDRLSLEIGEGTIFGFLGPNGAGKTTTVKMTAGIMQPTSGRILIDGIDLSKDPAMAKRRIGFIPDRPFLYEKLTATEFLRFIGGLYGMDGGRSLDSQIEKVLNLFDLLHWSDELIESYSHGMKQRLVMSAALIHGPKVLIVDEPMVGLDPRGAKLVKEVFREEARKGTTIFMSTHSLDVAQEVCREIGIIQAGKLIARGSAEDLGRMAGVEGTLEKIFLKLTEGKSIAHGEPLSAS
ncbi:MAG: ABC transporter ATP-binding protein [Desulfatiglandales bacterium]|jgi:ABC-2 type transport system ATP-binding protein